MVKDFVFGTFTCVTYTFGKRFVFILYQRDVPIEKILDTFFPKRPKLTQRFKGVHKLQTMPQKKKVVGYRKPQRRKRKSHEDITASATDVVEFLVANVSSVPQMRDNKK